MSRITKEILKNFNECAVQVVDTYNNSHLGWFICNKGKYKLFPLNTIWETYTYKVSHIKSIRHLTNNFKVGK